ncbi:MAG: ExeM/NucH family extracellular endonuclease, partial [Candidatus Limnocylindrales bacterium]
MHRPARAPRRSLITVLTSLGLLAALLPVAGAAAFTANPATVWINEVHYDNASTDMGEAIEIAGPAGTNLGGWSIVPYNGNGGAPYTPTIVLSGTIPDQQDGFGTLSFAAPGLQNGDPDGMALVNGTTLVQFLSYDGTFTGVGGSAGGILSTSIGGEASTSAVGDSLQLTGTGFTYQHFTWATSAPDTFGNPNTGQTFVAGDLPPTVSSSTPADGATNVAVDAALSVTFSEEVVIASGALVLTCDGVDQGATVSGDPGTTFALVNLPLPDGASCTIEIDDAGVTDTDTDDPPDTMAADATIAFTVVAADPCAGAFTPIYDIQGSGASSPLVGQTTTTEGVVTALLPGLRGFSILDTTGDADAVTSDGIFVFRGPAFGTDTPSVGDELRVTGRVTEFQNQTELDNLTEIFTCGTTAAPDPVTVVLPETVNGDLERYEGTVVTIPQTLTAQQNFFQGRFGQVTLASGDRLDTPTDQFPADSPERIALADANQRRLIVLDDANSGQNPNPIPFIGAEDTLRAGDTTAGITGLLDEGAINSNTAIRDYRIQATEPVTFSRANERTAAPEEVGGWLQVASFNVLNYFNGDGLGGGFPTERGADTPLEFERQRDKIIAAIVALDADVVGLMEIENDGSGPTSAIADLVAGLNDATSAGTYA